MDALLTGNPALNLTHVATGYPVNSTNLWLGQIAPKRTNLDDLGIGDLRRPTTPHVCRWRHWFEVVGANAQPVSAEVVEFKVTGDRSVLLLPGNDVGRSLLLCDRVPGGAVSLSRFPEIPHPARGVVSTIDNIVAVVLSPVVTLDVANWLTLCQPTARGVAIGKGRWKAAPAKTETGWIGADGIMGLHLQGLSGWCHAPGVTGSRGLHVAPILPEGR